MLSKTLLFAQSGTINITTILYVMLEYRRIVQISGDDALLIKNVELCNTCKLVQNGQIV